MNVKDRKTEHETLTRRVVLTGGLGCALTLLVTQRVLGAGANGPPQSATGLIAVSGNSELYVFRGTDENRTVIAATWMAMHDHGSTLRVHAGDQSWAVEIPDQHSSPTFTQDRGCLIFAGDIENRFVGHDTRFKAVVIELPTEKISQGGSIPVWAERISEQGRRLRMGSPFIAKLIAGNVPIAKLYHASSPAQDGEEFTRLVADAIAANAQANGCASNAHLYGRRVASAITPDALRYDPQLPVGFTFAAQNGRHPDDAAQSVVDTVLNATPTAQVSQSRFSLRGDFPYFSQPSTHA
jgi:hypothetical protein